MGINHYTNPFSLHNNNFTFLNEELNNKQLTMCAHLKETDASTSEVGNKTSYKNHMSILTRCQHSGEYMLSQSLGSTLKIEEIFPSELLVSTYKTSQCHNS
jgi:hypothetical protein